ncbi:MAG TPA: aminoacyl-tRNA hydrolase [Patescibacteria group bacterium]|nr:aminoacyl-tRNA hydrolase [Patescibacteria group bacterium]
MKLIAGLGNPGKKYEVTRHNVGWLFLDTLAPKAKWHANEKAKAEYTNFEINDKAVEIIKPQTFMNNSGVAVALALKKHSLKPTDLIVIHDDKDIAFGEYKIQTDRGPAGHNGVRSIIEHLGTQNFTRIRIGVAPATGLNGDTADFVLAKFTASEKKALKEIFSEIIIKLSEIV